MKSKLVLGLAVLVWISWGGGSLLHAQQSPNANRPVQAVVFDAYGTLFNPHTVVPISEEMFPGRGSELSNIWRAKQLEYTWLRGLMGQYEDFWQVTESALLYACKTLQLQCGPSTHERMMESYLKIDPYPEVRQALGNLSGYQLAILSNGTPDMLQKGVESAGLDGFLSQIISVDEAKTFKPNPRVYQLAVEKLGVEKGEIAFISSNAWDIIGATAFGFWTCWVNRSGATMDELGFRPNATVNSLTDVVNVLPGR
ncbi:MAG: haloacid dehalogenase type II [Acidobacteriota bacterium]